MTLCITSLNDLCDGKWGAGRKEAAHGGEVRESGSSVWDREQEDHGRGRKQESQHMRPLCGAELRHCTLKLNANIITLLQHVYSSVLGW